MTNNTTADTTASEAGEAESLGARIRREGDLSSRSGQLARLYDLADEADTLRAQLEAAEAEVSGMRARMFYLATDGCVEGFVHVNRDVYDFASEMAELAAREEPNDDDLIDGFCQLIDAARKAATP